MHDSFEIAVAHFEMVRDEAVKNMLPDEFADRDAGVSGPDGGGVDSLGQIVYDLKEELERLKTRHEQELGAALDRTQLSEEMADSLKEVRQIVTRSTSLFHLLIDTRKSKLSTPGLGKYALGRARGEHEYDAVVVCVSFSNLWLCSDTDFSMGCVQQRRRSWSKSCFLIG